MVSYVMDHIQWHIVGAVLILVVMEDGLVPILSASVRVNAESLNPCCDGRWSRTTACRPIVAKKNVLILVVMEDGLVHNRRPVYKSYYLCLNPCCDGRWSRTWY